MSDKSPIELPSSSTPETSFPLPRDTAPASAVKTESTRFEAADHELMEEVVKIASLKMNLTVPAEFNPQNQPGFFMFTHRSTGSLDRIEFPPENELAQMKVTESLAVLPSEAAVYETEMVNEQRTVTKPALWGLMQKKETQTVQVPKQKFVRMRPKLFNEYVPDGAAEPAYRFIYQAQDDAGEGLYREPYQGGSRRAQLTCNLVLPESVALKLLERIKSRPELIGKIFQLAAERHFGMPQEAYEKGTPETDNKPLGPPYEAWRAKDGGTSRLYLMDFSKIDATARARIKTSSLDPRNIIEH